MVLQELGRALHNLVRAPKFYLAVAGTLAIAVGGSGGLFSLLSALTWRALPVPEPQHLVSVYPASGEALFGISMPTLTALASAPTPLESVCGLSQGSTIVVDIDGSPVARPSEAVTGECYNVLKVQAFLGRLVGPEDAPLDRESLPVVSISYRFWQDSFGGSPDAIGRTIRIQGQPATVIGVLPPAYRGVNADEAPDVSLPLDLSWRA